MFLIFFVFLFAETRYGSFINFPNLYFRFDPLIFILTGIAGRTIVVSSSLSLIVILITFAFGRFFCGYVCPLGTVIDLSDRFLFNVLGRGDRTDWTEKTKRFLKYIPRYLILIFLLFSALLGVSFIHFFDPLVIFERTLTLVFYPITTYFISFFSTIHNAVYTETLIALVGFVFILVLGIFTTRFWCRFVCPLGALFAILSRLSLFRFAFASDCKNCAICAKVCPTDAIDFKEKQIDAGECISCFQCQQKCPQMAIKYQHRFSRPVFNVKRREFITAIAAGIIAVPLVRSFMHRKLEPRLIRPPGAVPEQDFLNLCIHCGKCIKVCPTNGLQPCILESGVNGIWTPRLVPRIGGCEKNCNACGMVCPTSAIRNLSLEEKSYAKIGTAVIDRFRCIAWEQDKPCLICDEACQYNAINIFNETIHGITIGRPYVDERICTGCGICESRCPVKGSAAIEVYSIGEERKRDGSYITPEKIKLRACEEKPDDIPSGFIIQD